ncbi:hypothetical protein NN561_002979 [Cricetulus griseus]
MDARKPGQQRPRCRGFAGCGFCRCRCAWRPSATARLCRLREGPTGRRCEHGPRCADPQRGRFSCVSKLTSPHPPSHSRLCPLTSVGTHLSCALVWRMCLQLCLHLLAVYTYLNAGLHPRTPLRALSPYSGSGRDSLL